MCLFFTYGFCINTPHSIFASRPGTKVIALFHLSHICQCLLAAESFGNELEVSLNSHLLFPLSVGLLIHILIGAETPKLHLHLLSNSLKTLLTLHFPLGFKGHEKQQ